MAYNVFWIVEHRVLYIDESEQITLEDIRLSTRETAAAMDEAYQSGAALIIGILNVSHADLSRLMRSVVTTTVDEIASVIDPRLWKAKPGFIILITASETAKMLLSLVIRLSSQPMTTVGTVEEALTVVSYMYPELADALKSYRHDDRSAGTPS
ncbi:MAG: hypothetical protein U0670_14490 [Anaerolineae bacterium]